MFFNIDHDERHTIGGWLAPDNPAATPKIAIVIPGRPETRFEANVARPDIVHLGLHSTGQVGFLVDASLVPDIETLDEIELLDAETRVPIYRRFHSERHVERKFFLFDCAVAPSWRNPNRITDSFALNYQMSERYSLETMMVLISNPRANSVFFSGRSNFTRYAGQLEAGGYLRAALLRNPIEELAERLLFLSLLQRSEAVNTLANFTTGILPLAVFSRDLAFSSPKAILSAFRAMGDDVRETIMSPMVRMFGCSPDEFPCQKNVSLALDRLATLDVVGVRSHFDLFKTMIGHSLGADVFADQSLTSFHSVARFAETLSQIGVVLDLLADDIELYEHVEQAVVRGSAGEIDLVARDSQTI